MSRSATLARTHRGLARLGRVAGSIASFLAVGVVLSGCWELYKFLGERWHDRVPGIGWQFPVATDDLSLPHVSDIVGSLFRPTRRGSKTTLLETLLRETGTTLRTATLGFLGGALAGILIALIFTRLRPVSRGMMPWLVASQTVPLVAIAPMVVIWGGKIGLPVWGAVAMIAVYLAFFPVTINALRGLTSSSALHHDLLKSWGASERQTTRYLRVPGAVPHLFTGLRLAATASVIGTLVGELSAGTGSGLGRAILNFSYFYSNGPEKLYAAVLVASLVGMAFVFVVIAVERLVTRNRWNPGRRS